MKQIIFIMLLFTVITVEAKPLIQKDVVIEVLINNQPDNLLVLNNFLGIITFQRESTGCHYTMTSRKMKKVFKVISIYKNISYQELFLVKHIKLE